MWMRPVPPEKPPVTRTRAGSREPDARRWAEAGELRDAEPSPCAGNRPPDPGARRLKEAREASREKLLWKVALYDSPCAPVSYVVLLGVFLIVVIAAATACGGEVCSPLP